MNEKPIFVYSRRDAIADGVFKDVTPKAKEAGIRFETAISTNLWNTYICPCKKDRELGQDEMGRLWDVLWMFRQAARAVTNKATIIDFTVIFLMNGRPKTVKVWASIEANGPQDPTAGINIYLAEDY